MDSDSKLLAEAYVNEISRMPDSDEPDDHTGAYKQNHNTPHPQYEGNVAELVDSLEDVTHRLAGVVPRDFDHPSIEAALKHMRGILADLVDMFDSNDYEKTDMGGNPDPEVVPNVKRF